MSESIDTSLKGIDDILSKIPPNLEGIYDSVLCKVPVHARKDAHEMLHLLTSAQRPLTMIELGEASVRSRFVGHLSI